MREYLESMKYNTPPSKVYEKLRQIRGRPPRRIGMLDKNGVIIATKQGIVDCLAENFSMVSDPSSCSREFKSIKDKAERQPIDFDSDNREPYNDLFTMTELTTAINGTNDTAPGPDKIHYKMFKHLPQQALEHLLKIFNLMWVTAYYPDKWRDSLTIPIPKPNKDHSDPKNYRPIALTSCFGKLFEKMINARLVQYLEYNKLLCAVQCGFRANHSTIDHLTRLDTYIRQAMADGKYTIGVFFDLEKAYDTTWRFGILRDMYRLGLRGRLPKYIKGFMKERRFQVTVDWTTSSKQEQKMGVPQGSILSVTLFAIKINALASKIPAGVHKSLFVDNLQITYSHHDMHHINAKLQETIVHINRWATANGFSFSTTKTVCMTFYRGQGPIVRPNLIIGNIKIPSVETTKFLSRCSKAC